MLRKGHGITAPNTLKFVNKCFTLRTLRFNSGRIRATPVNKYAGDSYKTGRVTRTPRLRE